MTDGSVQATSSGPSDRERRIGEDLRRTAIVLLGIFVLGWAAIFLRAIAAGIAGPVPGAYADTAQHYGWTIFGSVVVAFLWSLASLALGFVFGFIFGVPKLQTALISNTSAQALGLRDDVPRLKVNTNLEDISDWLTKVLVGATLTQISKIPPGVKKIAEYMSTQDDTLTQFNCAILLYFTAFGFLAGYIMTRMFFARAFARAD